MSGTAAAWQAPLARYALSPAQHGALETLLQELERDIHAPTTVRERAQAAKTHLADSLVALDIDRLRRARLLADLGAGAGFPGLALAVALADAEVRLVESQRRKCEFVRRLAAVAQIANATVICERAERWTAGLGTNDAVLARALAPQPVVLEYAAPLLRRDGVLVDWRGRRSAAEERAAARAAATLGLRLLEIRAVVPFPGARDRHLHVFVKQDETPARFPRRAGVARKRPLGSDRDRR
jgi:16S rRNA (guanine527-N7)-methyltransferase